MLLAVSDEGPGLPAELISRLFSLMPPIDSQSVRLGLGLRLCRVLVRVHCGDIWIEVPRPGHGASFASVCPTAPDLQQEDG